MLGDTIAAVASPPGVGARGVIRVSGPQALTVADNVVGQALPRVRGACTRAVRVRGYELPALCLVMPGPGSYTGEDVVELHLPGGPLLLQSVLSDLEGAGARRPGPGEFSRRAYEHGRLRLEQAEAVADLIAADGEQARRLALYALSGGLADTVAQVRSLLQDACAVLESGLDFTADETGAVPPEAWLGTVGAAESILADSVAQLPAALPGGELLLLGAADAGKSSLCNALAQRDVVMVGEGAGTTRDVIAVPLPADGPLSAAGPAVCVTLLDAPGDVDAPGAVEAAALALRDRLGARAGGVLMVVDLAAPRLPRPLLSLPVVALVATKSDLVADPHGTAATVRDALAAAGTEVGGTFVVSSRSGDGIDALRHFLHALGARGTVPEGTVRWRDALRAALVAVQRARTVGDAGGAEELAAADLSQALHTLDTVHGSSSPEELLDRIFARFCLGK